MFHKADSRNKVFNVPPVLKQTETRKPGIKIQSNPMSITEAGQGPLRCLRTDLLFAYKIVFGMLDVNVADFFYN